MTPRRGRLTAPTTKGPDMTDHPQIAQLLGPGCPDCTSTQTMVEVAPGIVVVSIGHDDTCPWWQAHQARSQGRE
jgi:hypothetical protein